MPDRPGPEPIVPGFYPDPTICRVGDDYYLAHSSFEYFPGVPIWHSRDLLRWTQIGHILTRRSQFVRGDGRPSNGIYAGTLRHHEGRFWYITTNVSDYDAGQLIVQADDPAGPWTEPVRVPEAIGIDPDLYPLLASSQTRTGGANVSGLQDQGLDKLLTAARAPTPDAGRPAAYSALQKALSAGTFILPIAFRDEVVVLRDTVTGPAARPVATSGDRFWDVLTWRLAAGR